jgi:hypothetical protein
MTKTKEKEHQDHTKTRDTPPRYYTREERDPRQDIHHPYITHQIIHPFIHSFIDCSFD